MSFTLAMLVKPLVFLGAIAALAFVRKGIIKWLPDSKLKRILLTDV